MSPFGGGKNPPWVRNAGNYLVVLKLYIITEKFDLLLFFFIFTFNPLHCIDIHRRTYSMTLVLRNYKIFNYKIARNISHGYLIAVA